MKKLMFVGFLCVFVALIAEETNPEETNWIPQDGWVTGPGSGENKDTFLLPFGHFPYPNNCAFTYTDEQPVLYETDMGWPVPDEDETELKYLFFENEYLPRPFLKPIFLEGKPIDFKGLTFIPIRHKHGETIVTSLRFKDFALLADINSIEPEELDKVKDVKILAISSTVQKKHPTHFSFEEILDLIKYISPERAYLTHMNHTFDYEETLKKVPENVVPAIDGMKIEF